MLSRPMLLDQMAVLLEGWAAERLVFGHNGSGVAHDVERASDLARRMVREFAMSDAVGPLHYGDGAAMDGPAVRELSEEVARTIDAEIRRLAEEAGERAIWVLTTNRAELDAVATALLERESLKADELVAVRAAIRAPAAAAP